MLRCFGVALHETFHAKHTKRWTIEHDIALSESENPDDRQLAIDRRLLEEPRMEAHGVREHPPGTLRGRFVRHALRAAVTDVILPVFAGELLAAATAGRPLTRDMAGRATVYLQARTHYGILDPAVLDGLRNVWRQVLGDRDLAALDELFARLIWIPDGELEALDRAAARVPRDHRPARPTPVRRPRRQRAAAITHPTGAAISPRRARWATRSSRHWSRRATASSSNSTRTSTCSRCSPTRQPAARRGPSRRSGRGTGMPTGRMPDRGVDRPPAPDEVQQARRYATRLRQAMTQGTRRIDKRTPGGRFDGRAYARGKAQRQTGRPVSTHPWRITRQVTAPIQEPHVGLVIDTSGSMAAYEYALGPDLLDPHRRPQTDRRTLRHRPVRQQRRPARRRDAAAAARSRNQDRRRHRVRRRRDRAALRAARDDKPPPPPTSSTCSQDGGWADTQAGVARIRWLAEHDVPTIHLSIGIAPLSVECDRIHVITDPAQALDHIAADTVAALRARTRTRPTTPST